jgi:serine/threonine protein kinase
VVKEIAISKLCSVLGVGPEIETSIPFDVVVYDDAIQFHLEKCEQYSIKILRQHGQYFKSDLKECLRVLHSIGIVHRDIKLSNVLWSNKLHRFVLCDFGVSISITESVG